MGPGKIDIKSEGGDVVKLETVLIVEGCWVDKTSSVALCQHKHHGDNTDQVQVGSWP